MECVFKTIRVIHWDYQLKNEVDYIKAINAVNTDGFIQVGKPNNNTAPFLVQIEFRYSFTPKDKTLGYFIYTAAIEYFVDVNEMSNKVGKSDFMIMDALSRYMAEFKRRKPTEYFEGLGELKESDKNHLRDNLLSLIYPPKNE